MKAFLILTAVCLSLFFSGCSKNKEIKFQDDVPHALSPDVKWAVVIDPYAAYRSETDWSAEILGHCRKGNILEVKGTAVFNDAENWYYFDGGWLPESAVNIYSNRYKAQTAVGQLK